MTHDTDALVSELRDVFRVDQGETLHPRHPKYLGNLAADAIARLTRERDEARKVWDDLDAETGRNPRGPVVALLDRAETAEAELSAARAELAVARNKALEEAAKWIRAQMNGDNTSEYHAGFNDGLKSAAQILSGTPLREELSRALKSEA